MDGENEPQMDPIEASPDQMDGFDEMDHMDGDMDDAMDGAMDGEMDGDMAGDMEGDMDGDDDERSEAPSEKVFDVTKCPRKCFTYANPVARLRVDG
jgi:hypothetical protein